MVSLILNKMFAQTFAILLPGLESDIKLPIPLTRDEILQLRYASNIGFKDVQLINDNIYPSGDPISPYEIDSSAIFLAFKIMKEEGGIAQLNPCLRNKIENLILVTTKTKSSIHDLIELETNPVIDAN